MFFLFFQKFDLSACSGVRRGGGKRGKNGPKLQKNLSVVPFISETIYHMVFIYGTHVCIKE